MSQLSVDNKTGQVQKWNGSGWDDVRSIRDDGVEQVLYHNGNDYSWNDDVGAGSALASGLGESFAGLTNALATVGSVVPMAGDAVSGAFGADGTPASDWYQENIINETRNNLKFFQPQAGEHYGAGAEIARAGGNLAGILAAAIPAGAANFVGRGGAALAPLVQNLAKGTAAAETFAVPATINRAQDLVEQGVDTSTVMQGAASNYAANMAMGLLPVSMVGNVATRMASGAALSAGSGAAQRGAEGLTLGEEYKNLAEDPLDPKALAFDGAFGTAFSLMGRNNTGNKTKADVDAEQDVPLDDKPMLALPAPDPQMVQSDQIGAVEARNAIHGKTDTSQLPTPSNNNPFMDIMGGAEQFSPQAIEAKRIESERQAALERELYKEYAPKEPTAVTAQSPQLQAKDTFAIQRKERRAEKRQRNTIRKIRDSAELNDDGSISFEGNAANLSEVFKTLGVSKVVKQGDVTTVHREKEVEKVLDFLTDAPVTAKAENAHGTMATERFNAKKEAEAAAQAKADAALEAKALRSAKAIDAARQRKLISSEDSLDVFIRKMGGVNDGDFARAFSTKETGNKGANFNGALTRYNGKSADAMAELAHEAGYIKERSPQALYDALDLEINQGVKQLTPESANDQAEADYVAAQMKGETSREPAVKQANDSNIAQKAPVERKNQADKGNENDAFSRLDKQLSGNGVDVPIRGRNKKSDAFDNMVNEAERDTSNYIPFSRKKAVGREAIGEWSNQRELINKVKAYAMEHFAGKSVTNKSDGRSILIPRSGIKHTAYRLGTEHEALATLQIPDMLKSALHKDFKPDYKGRGTVKGVHIYEAEAKIDDAIVPIRIFVRETNEGDRFYDHYEIKEENVGGQSGERDEPLSNQPTPTPSNTPSIDPLAHKKQDSVSTLTHVELDAVIERVINRLAVKVGVAGNTVRHPTIFVDSFSDLPPAITKHADNEGHDGGDVGGVFHKGKVYVVKSDLANYANVEARLEEVLLHEFVHADIHTMFGKDLHQAMNNLWLSIGGNKGIRDIAKQRGINLSAYAKAGAEAGYPKHIRQSIMMDELLAHIGQVRPDLKAKVKTIIGHIRNWLRKKGFKHLAEYGETDLLSLISTARKQVTQAKGGDTRFMVAWHGSPHDHNKFDMNKVGTGEGNQAYGHGLYFAGNKEVAEWYRKSLTGTSSYDSMKIDGEPFMLFFAHNYTESDIATDALMKVFNADGDINKAVAILKYKSENSPVKGIRSKSLKELGFLEEFKGKHSIDYDKKGKLYQVKLAPKEDEYLLWDKPLMEQGDKVKEAIAKIVPDKSADAVMKWSGSRFYKQWIGEYDDIETSELLLSKGIRGIKYLDGSSRGKGDGDYNYVIFSDEDVSITAKFSRSETKQEEAEVKADYQAVKGAVKDYMGGKKSDLSKLGSALGSRLFFKPAQVVRDHAVKHARKIADEFLAEDRHEKRTSDAPDMMTQRFAETGKYMKRFQDIIEPLSNRFTLFDRDATGLIRGLPSDDNIRIVRALRKTGAILPRLKEEAKAIRSLLNDLRDYANAAGLDIGEIKNYFPRVYDVEKISKNAKKFVAFLEKEGGYDNAAAQRIMHRIINSEGSPELYGDHEGRVGIDDDGEIFTRRAKGKEGHASKKTYEKGRKIDIDEALLEKWLVNDVQAVMVQHVNNVVRRAEYARRFGANEETLNADVRKMVEELEAEGKSSQIKQAVDDVYDMADATMGKYSPIRHDGIRNANRYLSDAMVMIHLPFVAFSSMPEFLAPIVHGGRHAVIPILKATVVHGLNEATNSIAKMVIGKRLWDKSEWTQAGEEIGLITQAALSQAVQARMGHKTGKWTNRFIRATMLEQMTGLQKVMAMQTFKAMMKSHAKNLDKGVKGKKREQILQDIRDYGLGESQVKAWAKDGEGEAAMRMASVAFVNKVITTPNEANTPLHVQNPHFAQLMLFKRFITVFSNTFLKRMLQQIKRSKAAGAKVQGLVGAVLMIGVAYAAQSLRDDVKWGEGGNPYRKKDETTQRMVDAVDRAGFTGSFTWLYALLNPYRFGYSDKTSKRVFNLLGPALSDVAKTVDVFADPPKSKRKAAQKQGKQLSKFVPVLNAMEATRKPVENAFSRLLGG